MPAISQALCRSLIEAPPLIGDLPEADQFPHHELPLPTSTPLNLNQKLGHISEDALALLLEASPRYDLLARNLQIQKDIHTTVGELDFLLRDLSSGQLIHLELATKFYLAVHTASGLTLPGPDARDNYFKKLDHLRTHQLRLPALHQSNFPEIYQREPIVTQQLIHGCLFDPIHAPEPANAEFLNPAGRRGLWLSIDQLSSYFPSGTSYHIIPKPLWLAPLELIKDIPLEPWTPLATIDRCFMLRVKDEPTPYFVTPPEYP